MFNLAVIHEAIAAAIPERECLVFRDRRLTLERRHRAHAPARRRAARRHGLGCHRSARELANWESGQDHVALYLYNGNEYLEGMLGAFKARAAPFNVNYRYVDEELLYLFDNCRRGRVDLPRALRADPRARPRRAARREALAPGRRRLRRGAAAGRPRLRAGARRGRAGAAPARTSRPTTSTSSTPAAPPACPRACCGARRTSCAARSHRRVTARSRRSSSARRRGGIRALPDGALHARRGALGRLQHVARGRHGGGAVPSRSASTRTTSGPPSSARRSTRSPSWATPSGGRWSTSCARSATTSRRWRCSPRAARS